MGIHIQPAIRGKIDFETAEVQTKIHIVDVEVAVRIVCFFPGIAPVKAFVNGGCVRLRPGQNIGIIIIGQSQAAYGLIYMFQTGFRPGLAAVRRANHIIAHRSI